MFVKIKLEENKRNSAISKARKILDYYKENLKMKSSAAVRKGIERYQNSLSKITENVRMSIKELIKIISYKLYGIYNSVDI